MKLWQKIYLFSTLLLVLTLNISGFLLIQRFHTHLIQAEINKCISQQQSTVAELDYSASLLHSDASTPFNIYLSINSLMSPYERSLSDGCYQILDPDGNLIYTSFSFPTPNSFEDLDGLTADSTHYIIRNVGENSFLYISQLCTLQDTPIILYYAKDITSLIQEKYNYYSFFIKLDLIICFTFAMFMFFISYFITQPINTLINSTKKITEGHYEERAKLSSKDEFNTLATHFNLMAETIEENINELKLSNENKELFINNFTHELKTPLTSIIGFANLMRTSKYNEAIFEEATQFIYSEGKRLEKMAFKMMDLIYAKSTTLKLVPIDLMTVVLGIKYSLEPKLTKRKLTLHIQGSSAILPLDEILIHMLITNLVENAMKASKPYSTIDIAIHSLQDKIALSVTDYGIGIPKEHLSKLFDPFYMVDKARSRANHGAGIGLSICQKIAELHQAELTITSEVNHGTTVTLLFPIPTQQDGNLSS